MSKGYLNHMRKESYDFKSLMYPLELEGDLGLGHYMIFYINESTGSEFKIEKNPGKAKVTPTDASRTGNMERYSIEPGAIAQGFEEKDWAAEQAVLNQSLTRQQSHLDKTTTRCNRAIILYMPDDLSSNYSFGYDANDMTGAATLGAGAKMLTEGGLENPGFISNVLKRVGLGIGANAEKVTEWLGVGKSAGWFQSKFRMMVNPHMNMLFKSVSPREFSFNFNFMPKSEPEAQAVHNIVTAFKFYAHPELSGVSQTGKVSGGMFWTFPSEFEIKYFSRGMENEFIHKHAVSVCTGISVSYTPDGLALHSGTVGPGVRDWTQGNPPVRTDLKIQFREVELLTKERIKDGY